METAPAKSSTAMTPPGARTRSLLREAVRIEQASVIDTSAMTGTPVDPNMVSSIVQVIVEAFVAVVLAHGSYTLFWKA